jgi:linoleoyl-CoA desaturase
MEKIVKPVARPIFLKDSSIEIFNQIKKQARQIISELEPKRKKVLPVKAALFPLLYFSAYASALIWGQHKSIFYGSYFFMGIMLMIIFLNLIHDAVHGSLFKNKLLNKLYVYFFDLIGANSFVWKIRHTRLHHNYPNILGWDSDIDQSPLARVFPHGPFSKIHKYQHIYLPLLYPFYLINWLLVRDFKDYFSKKRVIWKVATIPKAEYVKLFLFKGLYLFYTIVIPVLVLHIGWMQAIAAFLIMVFTGSIFSLIVLLSPHANVDNDFPLPDNNNHIGTSWFIHQISHTNDVHHNNWFTRFFMGSFNYHVIHHLFPSESHIYYPELTAMLKKEAKKYNLPYRSYSLVHTLKTHYQLLKKNNMPENIFEETM